MMLHRIDILFKRTKLFQRLSCVHMLDEYRLNKHQFLTKGMRTKGMGLVKGFDKWEFRIFIGWNQFYLTLKKTGVHLPKA